MDGADAHVCIERAHEVEVSAPRTFDLLASHRTHTHTTAHTQGGLRSLSTLCTCAAALCSTPQPSVLSLSVSLCFVLAFARSYSISFVVRWQQKTPK